MNYFLFRFNENNYRLEKADTVQEACKKAFGVVYDNNSSVRFKNLGRKSPKYVSQKYQQANWYNDDGWEPLP